VVIHTVILSLLCPAMLFAGLDLSRLPPEVVPKNEYYGILSIDDSDEPGIYKFKVLSAHAVYEVEGFRPLIKLLHEIEVIERIRRNKEGSGFFDGAAASVEATVDGFENLVTHPIDSAKGLGRAAGKLGRGIGGIFRKKEKGERGSFRENFLGTSERELAKEFKVDVYTSNPYLRALLTKMARSRLGGKSAILVVKLLVPITLAASIAVAAGGINGAADQVVNDSNRKELYRLNKEALLGLGFKEEEIIPFLNQQHYSPREQTYFRFYLEHLHKAENFQQLAKNAAEAESEWDARRELYEAEMAAALNEKIAVKKIWDFPEGMALLNAEGVLQIVSSYDELAGDQADKVLEQIEKIQEESGIEEVQVHNTAAISEGFLKELRKKRFEGHAWSCLEPENE
jgi:hypothetical protein